MEKIASFTINHDLLQPGMYISRIDGDCVTYDLRMKVPNAGDYLDQKGLHTLEHLLATYLRNSERRGQVIYTGPMGCRTGFYLVMRDAVPAEEAVPGFFIRHFSRPYRISSPVSPSAISPIT